MIVVFVGLIFIVVVWVVRSFGFIVIVVVSGLCIYVRYLCLCVL